MKNLAASTKESLQTQKALQSLAASKSDIPDLISKPDNESVSETVCDTSQARDVTEEFLAPCEKIVDEFPESKIHVYRGIVNRLMGVREPAGSVAILSGDESYVVDVVLSADVQSALGNTNVLNHWKENKRHILGLAVFGDVADPTEFQDTLLSMETNVSSLLFMSVPHNSAISVWTFDKLQKEEGSVPECSWTRVKLGGQRRKRKHNEKISFVHANRIGVSFDDEVRSSKSTVLLCYCDAL